MSEEELRHVLDMVYKPGYAASYYMTMMHNENAKSNGWPLQKFYPEDHERAERESAKYYESFSSPHDP